MYVLVHNFGPRSDTSWKVKFLNEHVPSDASRSEQVERAKIEAGAFLSDNNQLGATYMLFEAHWLNWSPNDVKLYDEDDGA
jgi:hypothetical protein